LRKMRGICGGLGLAGFVLLRKMREFAADWDLPDSMKKDI